MSPLATRSSGSMKEREPTSFRGALTTSLFLHVCIFVVSLIGLPFLMSNELEAPPPINVEIVDIADVTQTDRITKPKPKSEVKPKPEPTEEKLEKPEITEIEEPEPEKVPEPEPELTPDPEPEVVEKAPDPEPQLKPEKPKEKPKPKEPKKEEPKPTKDLQSLLKDLTPAEDSGKPQPEQSYEEDKIDTSQIANLSDRLTISELDSFKRQIEPCWNVPAGAKYAEDLIVEVRVQMNTDRTVRQAKVLDMGRYGRDPHFRAAADSALRALRNPRCSPLQLPADKYDQWKSILIRFDPRDML